MCGLRAGFLLGPRARAAVSREGIGAGKGSQLAGKLEAALSLLLVLTLVNGLNPGVSVVCLV